MNGRLILNLLGLFCLLLSLSLSHWVTSLWILSSLFWMNGCFAAENALELAAASAE